MPFGAVFIELYFIMSSVWLQRFYYVFGFLALVLLILLITCAEMAIVLCYFQLCNENYLWQWRAFFNTGSAGQNHVAPNQPSIPPYQPRTIRIALRCGRTRCPALCTHPRAIAPILATVSIRFVFIWIFVRIFLIDPRDHGCCLNNALFLLHVHNFDAFLVGNRNGRVPSVVLVCISNLWCCKGRLITSRRPDDGKPNQLMAREFKKAVVVFRIHTPRSLRLTSAIEGERWQLVLGIIRWVIIRVTHPLFGWRGVVMSSRLSRAGMHANSDTVHA